MKERHKNKKEMMLDLFDLIQFVCHRERKGGEITSISFVFFVNRRRTSKDICSPSVSENVMIMRCETKEDIRSSYAEDFK